MKGKLFLFLFLFSVICKGQLSFDYKKDTIETFNVNFFKTHQKKGEYNFYRKDSTYVSQSVDESFFIEWLTYKGSNISIYKKFDRKGTLQRKVFYFQDFPIGNEYFFSKGKVCKIINHDENYKNSIEDIREIIIKTFNVDIFSYIRTPYYIEVARTKEEVYLKDWRYIYIIKFAVLAEEELVHRIYYIDANTGYFLYKDEYGTKEDFFQRAKDLPTEKIYIPLRKYSKFEPI